MRLATISLLAALAVSAPPLAARGGPAPVAPGPVLHEIWTHDTKG